MTIASDLLAFARNVTSQNGEDGIIEELCRRLDVPIGEFVEFGAWDGKYLSNTYSLLSKGWSGVYIEGDIEKYKALQKVDSEFSGRVKALHAYVQAEGNNTLDRLLSGTDISIDFDLLSIDIDSYDWQVWASLHDYRPKIVIIEVNTRVLPGIWQIHREGLTQGASFSATLQLGRHKGYQLVCHTGNMIFVRADLADKVEMSPECMAIPEMLFNYEKYEEEISTKRSFFKRLSRKIRRMRSSR